MLILCKDKKVIYPPDWVPVIYTTEIRADWELNFVDITLKQTLLAAVVASASITDTQAEINFTSWGGAYEISQQKAYADTWKN